MSEHLLPHPIKHFQVTKEAVAKGLPKWLKSGFYIERCGAVGSWWLNDLADYLICDGEENDYLVQPYRDDPNHIEVWTPEQFKARAGACAYEEAQYRHDLLLTETGELLAHAYSGVAVHPFSAYEEVEGNLSVETRNLKPTGGE